MIDAQRQLALAKRCHERQSSTHPAASSHPDRRAAFFLIDAPYTLRPPNKSGRAGRQNPDFHGTERKRSCGLGFTIAGCGIVECCFVWFTATGRVTSGLSRVSTGDKEAARTLCRNACGAWCIGGPVWLNSHVGRRQELGVMRRLQIGAALDEHEAETLILSAYPGW